MADQLESNVDPLPLPSADASLLDTAHLIMLDGFELEDIKGVINHKGATSSIVHIQGEAKGGKEGSGGVGIIILSGRSAHQLHEGIEAHGVSIGEEVAGDRVLRGKGE